MEVSPVHPENVSLPMLVTLSGIVMDVSPVQSLNALSPMLVIPSSKVIVRTFPGLSYHGADPPLVPQMPVPFVK